MKSRAAVAFEAKQPIEIVNELLKLAKEADSKCASTSRINKHHTHAVARSPARAKAERVKRDTSADSFFSLLKLSRSLLRDRGIVPAAFAKHGISFTQWCVLMKLQEGSAETASDLCRGLSHDNGALTRLLDQLEGRGYIKRIRSRNDRRRIGLVLTEAGRRTVTELLPLTVDCLNHMLAEFSRIEFETLTRLLHKLIENLRVFDGRQ